MIDRSRPARSDTKLLSKWPPQPGSAKGLTFSRFEKLNTSLVWVSSKTPKVHYGLIEYFCNWTAVDMVCVNQGRNLCHVRLPRVKCVLKVFHKGLQYNWKLFYIRRFTARLYVFAKGDICDNCFVDQMCVNTWYQYNCRILLWSKLLHLS